MNMSKRDKGFGLIEMMIVAVLIVSGSTVAVSQMRQAAAAIDADKASNMVIAELRYARQVAVDERSTVNVAFVGPDVITVAWQHRGGDVRSNKRHIDGTPFV